MTQLSRWLARYDLVRTAAVWLALAVLAPIAAYAFAAAYSKPALGTLAAAVVLLGVAGFGVVYAWRPGTGGPGD